MSYAIENNQDAVVQSVLQTTENTFVASKTPEQTANTQASSEVYFQIED